MEVIVKRNGQVIKEYRDVIDFKLVKRTSKTNTYRIGYTYGEYETIKIGTDCDTDIIEQQLNRATAVTVAER